MRIIIVFSSPGILEYEDVWHRLIDQGHGYIKVKNDSCDKIYAFDGHNEEYRLAGEWKTDKLIKEIDNIIKNNNNCECMIMLHDRKIPEALTTRFPNRIKDYSHVGSKFYENYIEPFRNGDKQKCFDSLWDKLQKDETVETYLKALSLACTVYLSFESKGRNMWNSAFGNNLTTSFEDTDVCKELKAKGIKSQDKKIVTAAKKSLSVVRKNNEL